VTSTVSPRCRVEAWWSSSPSQPPRNTTKPYQRRLTFTPLSGHRVRQFSEGTTDAGKTWSTEYDLIYVPQGAPFSAL